jgi:hypothetical protein
MSLGACIPVYTATMSLKCRISDLPIIEQRAKDTLGELKAKYSGLDAYLVYSSRLGQSVLGNKPEVLLKEFPEMFHDIPDKAKVLQLIKEAKAESRGNKEPQKRDHEIARLLDNLEVDEETQIELRFGQLRYELVWQLQRDTLVDQNLTPQGRSSIRIVLGTLNGLMNIERMS